MKISIIVPMYNVEKYISKCLDSLVNQTLKDIEIIIIDDGSTDNSANIVKEYMKKYNNIILLSQKNSGQAVARNNGIRKATGEFLCFVDSDDWIDLEMCEKLYNYNEKDIVYSKFIYYYDQNKQIIPIDLYKKVNNEQARYMFKNSGPCQKIIRRSLIVDNNLFFPEGIIYEDSAVIPALALYTDKIKYIDEPLYYYLQRMGSTMNVEKFSEKLLDVFKSVEVLENNFKNGDKENKYSHELEYLFITYFLICASSRFLSYNRYEELNKISNIMKEKYPTYTKNKYYNLLNIKDKIVAKLIYKRRYKTLKFLLDMKKKIKNIIKR